MQHIKGPDFPTGCMICGMEGIKDYFETGRGSVKVAGKRRRGGTQGRARADHHHGNSLQRQPRRAGRAHRRMVNEKVITDITAVRDESDENTRVVIEIKRDAIAKVVINNLYKHTALESSFASTRWPSIMAAQDAQSQGAHQCYIEHRREVVIRRTRFELRKAEERAETLEGLPHRPGQPGRVHPHHPRIQQPRGGQDQAARLRFHPRSRSNASASHPQRGAPDQRPLFLQRGPGQRHPGIAPLSIDRPGNRQGPAEYKELLERIKDLLDILAKEARVFAIIKAELQAIKEKHATPRLTELAPDEGEIAIEDLIANEGVIITITHAG
jgi:DNA gyrase subunit A